VAVAIAVVVLAGSGVLGGSAPRSIPGPARSPGIELPQTTPSNSAGSASTPAAGGSATSRSSTGRLYSLEPGKHGALLAPNTNPANRLVARGAALTLASPPGQMQTVANEVVSDTERFGGIVESSSVNVHGGSSYASFSLSVPATRLGALIGALSSLAGVRSLDQSTSDITNSFDRASAQLRDEKAERAALIRALAQASTLTQEQQIQARIGRLDSAIAAANTQVGALLSRGHNAKVAVQIVAGTAGAAGAGSGGPVNRALNDALNVLDIALAVALVALAILLPFALVGIALWWAAGSLRQRSRERALTAPAA
jgi:hypothetical protein